MKTASTSTEVFLSQHCAAEDSLTPIWPKVEHHLARNYEQNHFYNHMSAAEVKDKVPREIWDSYYKFTVERNPWDKTVSHYFMVSDRTGGNLSFDEYIERGRFCINWPRYCDSSSLLMVDKVIKYESLMHELADCFGNLGIPFSGSLGVNAKSDHRIDRRPYQELFSNRQRDIIERAFSKEIEMHNYSF